MRRNAGMAYYKNNGNNYIARSHTKPEKFYFILKLNIAGWAYHLYAMRKSLIDHRVNGHFS